MAVEMALFILSFIRMNSCMIWLRRNFIAMIHQNQGKMSIKFGVFVFSLCRLLVAYLYVALISQQCVFAVLSLIIAITNLTVNHEQKFPNGSVNSIAIGREILQFYAISDITYQQMTSIVEKTSIWMLSYYSVAVKAFITFRCIHSLLLTK